MNWSFPAETFRRWAVPGRPAAWALIGAAVFLSGCEYLNPKSSGPAPKTGSPIAVVPVPQKPVATTAAPHSIQVSLTPPVSTANCFVRFRPAVGQVPAMLQVTSYPSSSSESFPSILLRAIAPADKLRDLVDQPLAARMFVMRTADGPIWQTPDGDSTEIMIKTIDGTRAIGEIRGATLIDKGTGDQQQNITGHFDGVVK